MATPPLPLEVFERLKPEEKLTEIYTTQLQILDMQRQILDIHARTGVSDAFMAEMNEIVNQTKSQADTAQTLFDRVGTA